MGRRAWRIGIGAAIGLPLAALACNALSGAGDLTVGACDTCGDGTAPGSDGSNGGADGDVRGDASGDGGLDAAVDRMAMRPSFCDGIVMYARFDGMLTTAQGVSPDAPPANTFVPGHFGMGVLLTGSGSGMYYAVGDGGVAYGKDEGTFAMWLKPQWTWPPTVERIFWKPVADGALVSANASGPFIVAQVSPASFFGGYDHEPATNIVTSAGATAAELAPYWKADWNHVVETWSRSAPTISFTLNGADGDASVTRRETGGSWVAEAPGAVAYVRLASGQFPSDSAYDDVAMWSRSLSLAEIQAVYGAGVPIGDLCGL